MLFLKMFDTLDKFLIALSVMFEKKLWKKSLNEKFPCDSSVTELDNLKQEQVQKLGPSPNNDVYPFW